MARCSITPESLPIEYNITGLRNSAATSRMMPMDSASRRFKFNDNAITSSGRREWGCFQHPTRDEIRISKGGLGVQQRHTAGGPHAATCGNEDRMACCRIPLHCRTEPRIQVSLAGSDQTKLQRRPN